MDAHQLRLLRELGERGSVAAVADALYVTPSAVSQHLAALQREFDVPLTQKHTRRLVLTDAGRALAAAGLGVEESFAAARASVDAFLDDPHDSVSVSAFHSGGLALFGPLLATTRAELHLADGDVRLDEFPSLTLEHDIVIAHRLAHAPAWPTGRVSVTPLLTEPIGVAVAATHPLATRGTGTVTVADLADQRWVSVHSGFPIANLLDVVAVAAGRPPAIAHRVNEFFVAAAIVRTGTAVALMPRLTMQGAALDGVTILEIAGLPLARQIDALTQPQALHRRAVRDTLRTLQRIAKEVATAAR